MKFEHLVGKRALGSAHARDYTTWAESLLYEGVDAENVAILASIGLERDPDSEEVELYFPESVTSLANIPVKPTSAPTRGDNWVRF